MKQDPLQEETLQSNRVQNCMTIEVDGDLGCSKIIMKNSFFIGIHTGIKKQQQEFVKDTFNEFISERVRK